MNVLYDRDHYKLALGHCNTARSMCVVASRRAALAGWLAGLQAGWLAGGTAAGALYSISR